MAWTPLLSTADGAPASSAHFGSQARRLIDEILFTSPAPTPLCLSERALLELYCNHGLNALEYLDRSFDLLPNYELGPGLLGGLLQIGWIAAHILQSKSDGNLVGALSAVDDLLRESLAARPEAFDLVSGLVGIGVYALERGPAASDILQDVVEALARGSVQDSGAIRWSRDLGGPSTCGMAHGNAGVIAFLSQAANIEPLAMELLRRGIRWFVVPPEGNEPARLRNVNPPNNMSQRCAWCGGNLGIASALSQAGIATDNAAVTTLAYQLALTSAADIDTSDGFAADASLCHGAAGAAHVLAALSSAAPRPGGPLSASALGWYGLLLKPPGRNLEGKFLTRRFGSTPPTWVPTSAFLDGSTGVALALQAAVDLAEPDWDRILLCRSRSPKGILRPNGSPQPNR